jgi:predicted ATPase
MAETAVIDRENELAAIRALLDEVSQGPAALVLSGEAGIGKTLLWRVGVARARERFA